MIFCVIFIFGYNLNWNWKKKSMSVAGLIQKAMPHWMISWINKNDILHYWNHITSYMRPLVEYVELYRYLTVFNNNKHMITDFSKYLGKEIYKQR